MKIDEDLTFLEKARSQYDFGREADAADRKIAEDDNRFAYADDVNLDQWDKKAKKARGNKRPVLQWNRIPTYTQRIANDSRKNKPSIKISPGDDAATKHTAEYLQARIRHIEYESNVDTARDTVGKQQVTTGRGFMRVSTEWIPGTQKQRICVDAIPNQFSVVWDPASVKYDRSDADFCFVIKLISKDDHIRKYGEEKYASSTDFADIDSAYAGWIGVGESGEMIQVADYWFRKYEDVEIPAEGGQPARQEKVGVVYSCVINGAEVLKPVEKWLGSTIPIPPVWGEEAIVDGERRTFSLIRNVKTPQRDLNLAVSTLAEKVGQLPKSPYLVPDGAIAANHEADWANALHTPLAYLIYQQFSEDGQRQFNKPEFIAHEPPIQAVLEWMHECIDAIKAGMGIFDAALGAKSNEQSGVAIERRKVQGELTNLHFPDNQMRSNKYLGEIFVELITKMERTGSYPIRTEDGKTHIVPMGVEHPDWKTGEPVTHDLSSGQYGVYVSQGPSYDSARQEKEQRDIEIVKANPETFYAIGGSMLRSDDSPGADDRADAWEQYVSLKFPGMKFNKPGQAPNQPDPQALEQQLHQVGQKLQATEAFAKEQHALATSKQLEMANAVRLKDMELAFKREELAVTDQNAKLTIASKESIEQLEHDIQILMAAHQRQHELMKLQAAQAHASETQQGQQAHESTEAEAQRQAAADSQTQAQDHAATQADIDRQAAAETQQGEE